jgi:hypothetical protein
MSSVRMIPAVLLSAVVLSAAAPAVAGGKWLREGNTAIIDGPTKYTKAVEISTTQTTGNLDGSYGLIAFAPSGKARNKLRLGEINNLSVSYDVIAGVTAGGSPRMSIIIDGNRDGTVFDSNGDFDFDNDEIVFVSLGSDPGGADEAGDFFVSGNLILEEGIFTTASGSVVLGDWSDILAAETGNGLPIAEGAVDYVFTIVDFAGTSEELRVAVTAMQINRDKLNPKKRIPSTN